MLASGASRPHHCLVTRLLLLFALGCGATSGRPAQPPVPGPEAGAIAEPEAVASEAYVDLVLRTDGLQAAVDRELPNPIHRERTSRLEAEAVRGPLRVEPGGGGLLWTVPVEFWARASWGPLRFSCGLDGARPHVDVRLRTELRIDDEWNLGTTTTAGSRQWSRRCTVSFLNIDVTSMIDPHVADAQAQAAREIDSQAARFDLRGLLTRAWPMLTVPVDLESAGEPPERLRFAMRPVGLRVDGLSGDAAELRLRVAVVGRFMITSRFRAAPAGALPAPLEAPAPAFVANLEVPLDRAALLSELQEAVQGALGEIVVRAVELRIVEAGVALGIEWDGAPTPNGWALGTLVHERGSVRLAELRWTDPTRVALGDSASTLGQALFGALSGWEHPVGEALRSARERAVEGMRAFALEGVHVDAALDAAESGGIVFGDAQTLTLRVPTPGRLTVAVDALTVAGPL